MVRNSKYLVLVLFISFLGCRSQNDDDEIPVDEGEVITEIQSFDPSGKINSRIELSHDGSNFASYKRFDLDANDEWQFFQSVDFKYDNQDRLIEAIFYYDEDRSGGTKSKFGYVWDTDFYLFNRYTLNQSNDLVIDSSEKLIYNRPQNDFKELDGYIYGFENGNFIGMGGEDALGSLSAFGKTWSFSEYLIYDDNPNVRSDQAIDFILGQRNLFNSFNTNNTIGYKYPTGDIENYQYLIIDGKVRSISYEDGSKIEFSYQLVNE